MVYDSDWLSQDLSTVREEGELTQDEDDDDTDLEFESPCHTREGSPIPSHVNGYGVLMDDEDDPFMEERVPVYCSCEAYLVFRNEPVLLIGNNIAADPEDRYMYFYPSPKTCAIKVDQRYSTFPSNSVCTLNSDEMAFKHCEHTVTCFR